MKEVDYELQQELKVYEYIASKRLENKKLSEIIADVAVEHPEIVDMVEKINEVVTSDEIESQQRVVELYWNNKKVQSVLDFVKVHLSEIELESFASFSEKLDRVKHIITKAFEDLATISEPVSDDEFIIDDDVDIESQIKDEREYLTISTGFNSLDERIIGYQSARVVIYAGGTGKGKSVLLTNALYQLSVNFKSSDFRKLFEETYEGYKPMVFFLTNENSISESRTRLVSIITNKSTFSSELNDKVYIANELKKFAKKTGVVTYMKYVPARSTTAFDIYSMITDLERKRGYKCIGIVVDYLDRLRPLQKTDQERLALGFIVDELKTVSVKLNVPVITATQINREGYKEDKPGIEHIGESWKKVENADAVILFNSSKDNNGIWEYSLTIPKLRYADPTEDVIKLYRKEGYLRIVENLVENYSQEENSGIFDTNQSTMAFVPESSSILGTF
jgi:replicative DNA helicase